MNWYKGNLHCHSNCSDGQLPPDKVGEYYHSLGFDFLGISDHNQYTPTSDWNKANNILAIPACEYTGADCCHVVCVGVEETVAPNSNSDDYWARCTPSETLIENAQDNAFKKRVLILQDGIDKISTAGGIAIIAHPFWNWTYDYEEVLELKNCTHFELCNAGPDCNSIPIFGKSYPDEMWDKLLSKNYRIFGVANDDAHVYLEDYKPRAPLGGRGWNVVRANSLTLDNVLNALKKGHFYASTGVDIKDYTVTQENIKITINLQQNERVQIDFIGKDGEILQSSISESDSAQYNFKGDELYVRCRIGSTAGLWAWTQPIFMDNLTESIEWTK